MLLRLCRNSRQLSNGDSGSHQVREDQSTPSFLCLFLSSFLASASLADVVSIGNVWFGLAPESTYPCASLM